MGSITKILVKISLLAALFIAGCGVDQERFGEEAKAVRNIVPGLQGYAKTDPQRFANSFVQGKAPMANRGRYAMVQVVSTRAKVNGDEATLDIVVLNPADGEKIADKEWTAVKVDGHWKLQDAPLP